MDVNTYLLMQILAVRMFLNSGKNVWKNIMKSQTVYSALTVFFLSVLTCNFRQNTEALENHLYFVVL